MDACAPHPSDGWGRSIIPHRIRLRIRDEHVATQLQSQAVESKAHGWSPAARVGFRFCFVYFTLYCLSNQIVTGLFPSFDIDVPDPATLWPMRQIVTWVAIHLFRVKTELVYFSGSGDKTFDWVLAFCLLSSPIVANDRLVASRSQTRAILHAGQVVSAFHSLLSGGTDVRLWIGESDSAADAISLSLTG